MECFKTVSMTTKCKISAKEAKQNLKDEQISRNIYYKIQNALQTVIYTIFLQESQSLV